MTTWRDVADELTPAQVGELEIWEASGAAQSALSVFASEYAGQNATQVFVGVEQRIAGVRLRVCGRKQLDGSTERWVELSAHEVRLSDQQIQELCTALLDSNAEVSAAARTQCTTPAEAGN